MAKRSVEGSPWLALAHEGPFYSDDDVAEIVKAVDNGNEKFSARRRSELAIRLEQAAEALRAGPVRARGCLDLGAQEPGGFAPLYASACPGLGGEVGVGCQGAQDQPSPCMPNGSNHNACREIGTKSNLMRRLEVPPLAIGKVCYCPTARREGRWVRETKSFSGNTSIIWEP